MRKSIVIILAVAIIGALGIYSRSHNQPAVTAVDAASTTSSASQETTNPNQATDTTSSTTPASTTVGAYQDGTYSGKTEQTEYGNVQVGVVVSGGKITDVKFLQMPSDEGNSRQVTAFAESPLKQSTLQKQSANIDFVSGATTSSEAYQQSLQYALDQAG